MYDITNGKYFLADILPSVLNGTADHTDYQTTHLENGIPKVTTVVKETASISMRKIVLSKQRMGRNLQKIICYLDTATAGNHKVQQCGSIYS